MRIRKLRNIRPSGAFTPEMTSSKSPEGVPGKGTDNQGRGKKTIIGRERARENPKGTSDPGEALRVMFDRILRNFRLHMRAPFQGTPSGDF
jgi:hypothetical protein